jgi:hypothetical protein
MPSPSRYYSSTAAKTTLANAISASSTSLQLAAAANLPSQYPYTLILEKDTANEEVIEITGLVGTSYTIGTRGVDGSGAKGHAIGAAVEHGVSARDFSDSRAHEVATTGVHGITGDFVGTGAAQTITGTKTFNAVDITASTDIKAAGFKITNLAAGTAVTDAANLGQVNAVAGSASSAATSASSAAASAAAALASANIALSSAATATTSAAQASTSAATATTQAASANTSASSAFTSASSASTSAASALTSATSASASAAASLASAATALTSASQAATSASSAATSASSAAGSASSVAGQVATGLVRDMGLITDTDTSTGTWVSLSSLQTQTAISAASAATSATSAAGSATTAAASVATISGYATTATNSASAASTSATSAAASATAAANSAATASTSAATAVSSAAIAVTSAATATTSAATAVTSAATAVTSAATATTSAAQAATSATSAATSATSAATSASSAATSAASAAASASTNVNALQRTGDTMTGNLILNANPTTALGAVTKQYADAIVSGINFHGPVKAASITNLGVTYSNGTSGVGATLTADTLRAFNTLDGQTVSVGERVLIKDQATQTQNGIYTLTNNGAAGTTAWVLTRATDADNSVAGEMANGDVIFTIGGTVNNGKTFVNSSTGTITIGTTAITYSAYYTGLPAQTGSSGFYLTTDGTTPSWGAVNALPTQTGNTGKYLTTNGSVASWAAIVTDPLPQIFMMMGA